jgi:hypothetical protein
VRQPGALPGVWREGRPGISRACVPARDPRVLPPPHRLAACSSRFPPLLASRYANHTPRGSIPLNFNRRIARHQIAFIPGKTSGPVKGIRLVSAGGTEPRGLLALGQRCQRPATKLPRARWDGNERVQARFANGNPACGRKERIADSASRGKNDTHQRAADFCQPSAHTSQELPLPAAGMKLLPPRRQKLAPFCFLLKREFTLK